MHIAIVEDDPATRAQLAEYIQRYTRQYGTTFQVDTFADGDEIAENYRPVYDILFMDIEMKHLDGMEPAASVSWMGKCLSSLLPTPHSMPSTAILSVRPIICSSRCRISASRSS